MAMSAYWHEAGPPVRSLEKWTHQMDLQLATRHEGTDAVVVSVRGDVDNDTAPQLREALSAARGDGARRVVVDLSETDFLDSSGLGALVGASKEHAESGPLVLVCPKDNLRKLFEISRLDEVLPIYPSLPLALAD
jgi:anti-sigma B factor antagonist